MIKLVKLNEPPVLTLNNKAWSEAYRSNPRNRKYAHPDIKDQLCKETRKKCAYCESRVDVTSAEVEHIIPKSKKPALVCSWNNLTLVCTRCNRRKNNYFDVENPIINPYSENPATHIRWVGPMSFFRSPDKGRLTIEKLQLNDSDLMFRRQMKLDKIYNIKHQMENSPTSIAKALKEELDNLVGEDSEYTAASREFLQKLPF